MDVDVVGNYTPTPNGNRLEKPGYNNIIVVDATTLVCATISG